MDNPRGRGKRLSTIVTAAASSSTGASVKETNLPAPVNNVEKKKPGRKPSAATAAARKRSASPPKRKPSPGRKPSPARKASPARRASPARKASPGRKPKVASTTVKTTDTSPKDVKVTPEEPRRSERIRASEENTVPRAPTQKKSPVDKRLSTIMDDVEVSGIMSGGKASPGKSMTPSIGRRSNAITPTTERSRATVSRSMSALQDYSDHEDDDAFKSFRRTTDNGVGDKPHARRSVGVYQRTSSRAEFGGALGAAFLMVILPLFMFITNHFCSGAAHRDCQFTVPKNFAEFQKLSTYVNREAATFYGLFVFGVALLTGLPVGKQVTFTDVAHQRRTHTFNGLLVAFGAGLVGFVAEYCYKYPLQFVVSHGYSQLLVLNLFGALVVALLMLLRSRYVESQTSNQYAMTGNVVTDLFAGCDTHPVLLNVFDLKLITYHVSMLLALLFNGMILYRNLHFADLPEDLVGAPLSERMLFAVQNLTCAPVPVAAAGLTVLYLLDLLSYEHHLAASFELQQEGFGAQLLLRYAVFPFAITLLPKYLSAHKLPEVPLWAVAACVVIALFGMYIKRTSMRMKYLFRLNPLGEKVACLETYPTFQGRRLLVAKWWRFVRQPNYLGDILQNVALLPLLYWRFAWPPLMAVLLIVAILVHRAKRLAVRNAQKYDSSWQRYCNTVPHLLIPRVY